jgi:hypothetical protein
MNDTDVAGQKIPVPDPGRGARSSGYVLDPYDAVYIAIPKVACTSLKTAFAAALGLEGDVHYEADWPRIALEDLQRRHDGAFVFGFVRNPWDRLLSCYASKIQPGRDDYYFTSGVEHNFWTYGDLFSGEMSFEAFVEATASIPDEEGNIHFTSQHRNLVGADGRSFVDYIGRFETLAADFQSVCAKIALSGVELPHLYRTEHGHYSRHYTDRTARLVEQRWAEDIERFAYRFDVR